MHAAVAAEAYTCPKCGERSTKGQLSQTGFHCPRCTLELAHLDLAPNGTVRQVHGWLLAPGDLVQGRYRVTSVLGKGGFAATYLVTDERLQGKRRRSRSFPRTSTTTARWGASMAPEGATRQRHPRPRVPRR